MDELSGIAGKFGELVARQLSELRGPEIYRHTEVDELQAIRSLAVQCFGVSDQPRYLGAVQTWGACIETDTARPGMFYIGVYLDPPSIPMAKRRRQLIIYGAKISHIEQQARLLGFIQ